MGHMGIQARKIRKNKNNVGVWRARMRLPLQHPSWISWEFDLWKWCWPSQKLWANCDSQLGLLIANKQLRNTCQNSIHTISKSEYGVMTGRISNDALQTCTNKLQNSPHLQFATGIPPIWFNPDQKMPAKSGDKWQVQMASPLLVQKSSSSCRGLGDPIGFQGLFHPAGTQNSINDQVIESGAKKQCKKTLLSWYTWSTSHLCWSQKKQPVWLPGLLKSWTPVFCWSQ